MLAENYLDEVRQPPIQVRQDGDRWVLVKGLHRLEALKALGEATVEALVVRARRH
jgi:ParB-like chromosome segregation protein Spo0J